MASVRMIFSPAFSQIIFSPFVAAMLRIPTVLVVHAVGAELREVTGTWSRFHQPIRQP